MSRDMAELMDRDPLHLTDDDLDEIIKFMQAARQLWKEGKADAGNMKKTVRKEKVDIKALDDILKGM